MIYPDRLQVGDQEYEIRTSYLDALACIACIDDEDLSDTERAYGVIELLYPEPPEDGVEALRMAVKFLMLGKEPKPGTEDGPAPDMDYEHDMHYIRSSFRSDYGIDLNQRDDLHWWEFVELLQGLSDSCILNRVRDLRTYDLSSVKDPKARSRIMKAQRDVALPRKLSREDQDTLEAFYAQLEQQDDE